MDEIITKLQSLSATDEPNKSDTLQLLEELSKADVSTLTNFDICDTLYTLLIDADSKIRQLSAQCIAEIAKIESHRPKFTRVDVIERLIDQLKNVSTVAMPESTQMCRALGNILYENDKVREMIIKIDGDEVIFNLMDVVVNCENADDIEFIKVRGGLISNHLVGGEEYAQRAMDKNVMDKIEKVVEMGILDVEKNEDLLSNTLLPLNILTENVLELNFSPTLNANLARTLADATNPDLAEMCLELLQYQAENKDDVKLLLAKEGLCETIYRLLEKYKGYAGSSEARALIKLACDLIVEILTGDDAMYYLYSTPLLKYMEDWLDSSDTYLLTTGVLALANFARTDTHCIHMVENKIMNKLLAILSKNNGVEDDMRLQEALLSALRHLVIHKPNKAAVIEAGLVETILPMIEIHHSSVVFRLLGTLRMTVDGQETLALDLLQNAPLIERLVHWSRSPDHRVTCESQRLMAWLIKHAYATARCVSAEKRDSPKLIASDSSLKSFVRVDGTVESMVSMLTSQHLVMQNEALIALSILTVSLIGPGRTPDDVDLDACFEKYELGGKLAEFLIRDSDKMTKEVVENLQKFMSLLRVSDNLVQHLNRHNIDELLKSIPILTEYCTL